MRQATPDRWADLVQAFGRRGEDPSWCWCQRFLNANTKTPGSAPDNRGALHREIAAASVPPGLLAYVDGHPAGWTRIVPRSILPAVMGNRALAKLLVDDPCAWWVSCFAVGHGYRRNGVGSALLGAAVDFAREHGATSVEGHPVDVEKLSAKRTSGSALFTGTRAMFTAAGFIEVGRTFPTRPVMRRLL
ncbi:MAG: GNAT family N-acetyltransferase [Actinomycetota bacterium]|nr:GNAT family N-acetyltransferase [Actinomycetota bacterium]